jgi:hypothetical protein
MIDSSNIAKIIAIVGVLYCLSELVTCIQEKSYIDAGYKMQYKDNGDKIWVKE